VLYAGLPGTVLSCILLWSNSYSLDHKIEGSILISALWVGLSFAARKKVVHSIRVLSNVIASLNEGDSSFHAQVAQPGDAMGDLVTEVNRLARDLGSDRLGVVEAGTLLQQVIGELEGAIVAFAPDGRVKLFNRAAAVFLGKKNEGLLNKNAEELGIRHLLNGPASETISQYSMGVEKRWIVRRTYFRQHGLRHRLVMLSDASEALRAEEKLAWQRLVRVLSHEINNSLAPIKSVARTLTRISLPSDFPRETRENFRIGLDLVHNRVEALTRFLQGYAKLAKLPPPSREAVALKPLIDRLAALEIHPQNIVASGPDIKVFVDPVQLEQTMINLIRNAVESVGERKTSANVDESSEVSISWTALTDDLVLWVRDRGVGLLDTANLFVPFYTTKETGSGIGLVLSRQIIEAHGGQLSIRNREDTTGCEVKISIPSCVRM
jgi:nitrogen fixation/metabolism regulation signal transduction histidine kinase